MRWMYGGRPVEVPRTADILPHFMKNERLSRLVGDALRELDTQEAEDGRPAWRRDRGPIFTLELEDITIPHDLVTVRAGDHRVWAVHSNHKAGQPERSPFVRRHNGEDSASNELTIALGGTINRPVLVRVYSGPERPPLPWQKSAYRYDGDQDIREFWKTHAYRYDIRWVRGFADPKPPKWFTEGPRS